MSFRLDAGQIAELRGPNGVGKSTLLRVIAGFLAPAAGSVSWHEGHGSQLAGALAPSTLAGDGPRSGDEGVNLSHPSLRQPLIRPVGHLLPQGEKSEPVPVAERLHYVGHLDGLKSALTAGENLAFGRTPAGGAGGEPRTALDRLALGHVLDVPVGYLSAGQRRRVALARLLLTPRPLWLLDEPLTALDDGARSQLRGLIAEHLEGGGLVLVATHEPLGLPNTRLLRLEA